MSRFDDLIVFGVGYAFGMTMASKPRPGATSGGSVRSIPTPMIKHLVDTILPIADSDFTTEGGSSTIEQITALYVAASNAASRAHEAILEAWSANPTSGRLQQANMQMAEKRRSLSGWSANAVLQAPDVRAAIQLIQGATIRLKAATQEMHDVATAETAAASAVSAVGDLAKAFSSEKSAGTG